MLRTLLATLVVTALGTGTASAQQFVIFDDTWVHTADMPDSHYRVDPSAETPSDLTDPIDYAGGTVHLELEVLTKPTDEMTRFQVCFEASPTYGCTDQSPIYTTTGHVEWSTPVSDFWSPGTPDWSMGSGRVAIILKDTENGKPSADNVGAEVAARYMPTQVHLVITWVAAGGSYVPPSEPPVDAGVPMADAGAPDATPDAGAALDAGGGAEERDGGIEPDAGTPSDGGGGCAATNARGGATALPWLLLIGWVSTRRRSR